MDSKIKKLAGGVALAGALTVGAIGAYGHCVPPLTVPRRAPRRRQRRPQTATRASRPSSVAAQ